MDGMDEMEGAGAVLEGVAVGESSSAFGRFDLATAEDGGSPGIRGELGSA